MARQRGAGAVLASLGADGARLADGECVLYARATDIPFVNSVGAGDALLAGFFAGGQTRQERLATAMLWAASAVAHHTRAGAGRALGGAGQGERPMTMGQNLALGIDVGTTRIKAEVVGLDASELHCESALTPWQQRADGAQADLDELADVAVAVAAAAADWAQVAGHKVVSIGVTGMAETGALLDAHSRPLAPAFAWHHTLGDPVRVQEALGRQHFMLTTGRDCSISPSIIKLDMLRQRGHRFTRGQSWLNIPDYIAWRLCGVQAAEISTSSRTGLVDIAARTWWDEALEFLGAGRWLLPGELVPGGTLLGRTLPSLPASLQQASVATGGHDHPVGALAAGDSAPGSLGLSLGTAEAQVRIITPDLSPEDMVTVVQGGGTVDWHPLGDRWTVLGALPTGITLARLATLLGCETVADRMALSRAALDCPDL